MSTGAIYILVFSIEWDKSLRNCTVVTLYLLECIFKSVSLYLNILKSILSHISRNNVPGTKRPNNTKRVNELLNETETYAYTAECPAGGCICITEDTTTLGQCLNAMNTIGSSNDFTYKLWDILRGKLILMYCIHHRLSC